jgi:hypothetical protein
VNFDQRANVVPKAAVERVISLAKSARRTRMPAVALGVALTLVLWVLGQHLGALYSGQATDPNSGAVLAFMAIVLLAGSRETGLVHGGSAESAAADMTADRALA